MRSLETCTCNSADPDVMLYCEHNYPIFQINRNVPMQLVLLKIQRTVTLTCALVTQQPVRHCSASTIAYMNSKHAKARM